MNEKFEIIYKLIEDIRYTATNNLSADQFKDKVIEILKGRLKLIVEKI